MIATRAWLLLFLFPCSLIAQVETPGVLLDFFENGSYSRWSDSVSDAQIELGLRSGNGTLPSARVKHYFDQRVRWDGQTREGQRWEVFTQSRSQSLRGGDTAIVANWKSIGPNGMEVYGGRMISHAFDPVNPDRIWGGSATGGVWLSEDGGETWTPKSDAIPSTGVGGIAVNPLNPQSIIIGTGEGYTIGNFSVRPGIGAFISHDGGEHWKPTSFAYDRSDNISVFKVAWDATDTNRVYMATMNGLWVSDDAGNTWNLMFSGQTIAQANDVIIDPSDSETLYAAFEADGIYKSENRGQQWVLLTNGLPAASNIDFINIDICRSQPQTLYASITESGTNALEGLYRTDNGGNIWTEITSAPNAFCPPLNYGCQGWYDNAVGVSPHDPDYVVFGGITLWKTENGGQQWTQHDRYVCATCYEPPSCRTFVDHHDITFHPTDSNTIYTFHDGGVARSEDGGDCWENLNEGLITAQFYALASAATDTNVVIGGMQDHGLQGVDLGESSFDLWDKWGFLDGADVEINPLNRDVLYGSWIDGSIWKSSGGVHSVSAQITNGINLNENTGGWFAPLAIHPTSPLTLFTTTRQNIYRTDNGGGSWQVVANYPNVYHLSISPVNPDVVYGCAYNNSNWFIYRSDDGGNNWAPTGSAPGWRMTDIKADPVDSATVYATRNSFFDNNPHVYVSHDYGDTWFPLQGDMADIDVNAIAIHPDDNNCLFLATDLGVYASIDSGLHWTEFNDGLPVCVATDIHFHPGDNSLRLGTFGRGAWKTKAPVVPDDTITGVETLRLEHAAAGLFSNVGITPNPNQGVFQLGFDLNREANVRIEVFDAMNNRVYDVTLHDQLPARHEVLLHPGSGFEPRSNGLHIVRLSSGGMAVLRKAMIQR